MRSRKGGKRGKKVEPCRGDTSKNIEVSTDLFKRNGMRRLGGPDFLSASVVNLIFVVERRN